MDFEAIARDFVRAIRGRRSQSWLSRRLGYRTNVVHTWESGSRWPTAPVALRAAAVGAKVDLRDAVRRFLRTQPAWLDAADLTATDGVARLLGEVRGRAPLTALAKAADRSRFAVARWLSGEADPRLPDFFRLLEAASLRLLDFLALFVDVAALESTAVAWRRLVGQRGLAYEAPWSSAVLHALELRGYVALARHDSGWLATRLGIDEAELARCLERLREAGRVRWSGRRWKPVETLAVDTRGDVERNRELKAWWAKVGVERLEQRRATDADLFSFNVFAISSADLERLREMHLAYFRALRALVAESPASSSERVIVANVQLFALGPVDEPPGASEPAAPAKRRRARSPGGGRHLEVGAKRSPRR